MNYFRTWTWTTVIVILIMQSFSTGRLSNVYYDYIHSTVPHLQLCLISPTYNLLASHGTPLPSSVPLAVVSTHTFIHLQGTIWEIAPPEQLNTLLVEMGKQQKKHSTSSSLTKSTSKFSDLTASEGFHFTIFDVDISAQHCTPSGGHFHFGKFSIAVSWNGFW